VTKLRNTLSRVLSPAPDGDRIVHEAPQVPLRTVVRRFWPDARPYRRWIPALLALIALGALIETAEIWAFKLVVDEVLVPADLGPLLWIAAGYLGLTLLGALISFGDDYLATWLAERFLLSMRARVFSHVQSLSLDVFHRHRMGDLVTRVNSDVQAIESLVLSGVADGLSAILRIVFFTTALFILQWQLALVALVVAPLFWLVARHFSRLVKRASREKHRRVGSLGSVAEETFANAALIQATNSQDAAVARFRRQNEGILDAELAATRIRGLFSPLIDVIELAGVMVVVLLGTVAVANGDLTLGGMLVFIAYLTQLYSPVRELGSLSNHLFKALAGAERVIELLDEQPKVTQPREPVRLDLAHGALELDGVSFRYPTAAADAVRDVTLRVAPGETLALVGPSGAGKSTLAKLLVRLYDPDAGAIRLDGHDVRELDLGDLRRNVSILFQDAPVLHGSIGENIAFGRPGASRREIEEAARIAGLDELLARLPDGLDQDVGERGRRLSGGQGQRVAIARALLADAPVLALDEPSTGLDAEARERLLTPLRGLMRQRTTIIVSHDLLTVRDADLIAVLDGGRVVERGRHDELLAAGGLYARLWTLHQSPEGADNGDGRALAPVAA
jgi:ATP-binding cassette, subfamily B, bacterial